MEDPLRFKPVPLAAETVLWFEFLLDPDLISKHLEKPNPEPSALELITQFIAMTPDAAPTRVSEVITPGAELQALPGTSAAANATIAMQTTQSTPTSITPIVDGLNLTHKQLALKILAIKVATWLKWDLDLFENKIPVLLLLHLIRDLCTVSLGRNVLVPFSPDMSMVPSPDGNERATRFALTMYHRLLLRLQPMKEGILKSPRPLINNIYPPVDQLQQYFESPTQPSVDYLQALCNSPDPFFVFDYNSFAVLHPDSEDINQNYENMLLINPCELCAQVQFDLANFYLFTKQYILARDAAHACALNLNRLRQDLQMCNLREENLIFCHIHDATLEGVLLACGISSQPTTLLESFNISVNSSYKDITEILKLDNRAREIPLSTRRKLELAMEVDISRGLYKHTDIYSQQMNVMALNLVRSILESGNIFGIVDYFEKYTAPIAYGPVVEAIKDVLPYCTTESKEAIKKFLSNCILQADNGSILLKLVQELRLFETRELSNLAMEINEPPTTIPVLATLKDWQFSSKLPQVEIGAIERQLIACTNATVVRILLVKLAGTNLAKPLWNVNPSWEVPGPLKSLISGMPRGFLQDFSYVLLGKARELCVKRDYIGAVSMLSVLKSETQRQEFSAQNSQMIQKLAKLVNWEILNIQIIQSLDEWQQKPLDLQSLAMRCKQCMGVLQNGENAIPRIEIIENCTLMLLNLSEFQSLLLLDKRLLVQLELPLAFAYVFLEIEKLKGAKKVIRDLWELVLSTFLSNGNKRSSMGGGGSSRNSPSLALATTLQPFLKSIRNQNLFRMAISILGKIHNILKDDPNHDLICEYMQFWPSNISNAIAYNLRQVSETLQWLLSEALKYYPQTISWLKMKGDLEFALGFNESAMRYYVNALVTASDYCTIPLQRNIADDSIVRKMIRCASNLGCHMQATVLCQFLDEVDYGVVFKNLSEKSSNFTDAMDAYYSCIWDTTLLEFIVNLHAKRGEHSRKLEAIEVMGTLELNANNNDEIKREAASVRKARLIRALAKQYLL